MTLKRYLLAENGNNSNITQSFSHIFRTDTITFLRGDEALPDLAHQKNKSHHLAREVKWNIFKVILGQQILYTKLYGYRNNNK